MGHCTELAAYCVLHKYDNGTMFDPDAVASFNFVSEGSCRYCVPPGTEIRCLHVEHSEHDSDPDWVIGANVIFFICNLVR